MPSGLFDHGDRSSLNKIEGECPCRAANEICLATGRSSSLFKYAAMLHHPISSFCKTRQSLKRYSVLGESMADEHQAYWSKIFNESMRSGAICIMPTCRSRNLEKTSPVKKQEDCRVRGGKLISLGAGFELTPGSLFFYEKLPTVTRGPASILTAFFP